ncbi:hypothetical protein [Clavibacter zhangzhiyongii]|uniref:hypothetical protein n=1 Tax=Clavibacter zhangzhiyongii TaxID=2768071 RepID=UPI001F29C122|nr:hypothetical protein [Clavibacter zhangzhiyongii]
MTSSPPTTSDAAPGAQPRRWRGGSLGGHRTRRPEPAVEPATLLEGTVQAAGSLVLEAAAGIAPGLRSGGSIPHPARRRAIADTDLQVFPLALGGNVFGWTAGAEDTSAILDRYQEAGGNFIDTAARTPAAAAST